MSKILVTGGAGFIGSHTVDLFLEAGHEVVVLDNLVTGFRENLNPKAKFIEMDIRSTDLAEVFAREKFDVVDHFAAQMNVTLSLKEPLYDAECNVLGTVNLLQQCAEHGVKKFIFASTGGAMYGEPEDLPATEDFPPDPMSHYGTSKYAGERYIRLYRHVYQLPYTILRYANVYGPRQLPKGEAGVCAILAEHLLEGRRPVLYGHGKPLRDYVYVRDVARANLLALDRGDGACLNIATAVGTSVRAIFDTMQQIVGTALEPELQPLRPGEVFKIYCANARAKEVLGWQPEVDLATGLADTVAFFKKRLGR